MAEIEVLMVGPAKKLIVDGLEAAFKLHVMAAATDGGALVA